MDTSQQRASDADRNATTDRLRVAAEEGRLDVDELDQRVASALTARTQADLDGLTADLPLAAPPPPAKPRLWDRFGDSWQVVGQVRSAFDLCQKQIKAGTTPEKSGPICLGR